MTHSLFDRTAIAVLSALWLLACNGKLTVVDDLRSHPADLGSDAAVGSAGSDAGALAEAAAPEAFVPSGPLNIGCPCAATAVLQPLLCDGREVPLIANDIVQLSSDGAVVAFSISHLGEHDDEVA